MSNIVLLSLSLLPTNTFGYGATDEFSGWGQADCVTVTLTYAAQTSGVYVVEYTSSPEGAWCESNGCHGMRWTILNCGGLTNGAHNRLGPYPINHAAPRGYFTNASDGPSVHTITFPAPRWQHQFLRLRQVGGLVAQTSLSRPVPVLADPTETVEIANGTIEEGEAQDSTRPPWKREGSRIPAAGWDFGFRRPIDGDSSEGPGCETSGVTIAAVPTIENGGTPYRGPETVAHSLNASPRAVGRIRSSSDL